MSDADATIAGVEWVTDLGALVRLSVALGAEWDGLTADERRLIKKYAAGESPTAGVLATTRKAIVGGGDPLGDAYCRIVSTQERRPLGQTYTPEPIVDAMVNWAANNGDPQRIVDPGTGSGRYLLATARRFPNASVVGCDIDPIATLMLRANLTAAGLAERSAVHLGDYRELNLDEIDGATLFLGNPPYVRHHQIDPSWKRWLQETARERGLAASSLAGLHVHFFLATATLGRSGDIGAFITSSEWLDVNYGSLVRQLLLGELGGQSLHVIDPTVAPFADATTTGAIACFKIGEQPSSMKLRHVKQVSDLGALDGGRRVARHRLVESNRWSVFTRVNPKLPQGYMELGELCRVHRGAVTGANNVWVSSSSDIDLPDSVLYRSVTKARDLFKAGIRLSEPADLKYVIDLPTDLSQYEGTDRERIDIFLADAKKLNVHKGYVATNRKAWYSVGLRAAAPVLATYMARRPPAFVRNDISARHINIAHGLYPREELDDTILDTLASHLRTAVTLSQGRMYAGGLTKFEPKEMERLPIPSLDLLREAATDGTGGSTQME